MNSRSQLTHGAKVINPNTNLIHSFQAARGTAARLVGGVDAVLDAEDRLPFLALHYGQVRPLLQTLCLNHKLESPDLTIGHVDAVLDAEDPLPFLALHYGQVGPLLQTLCLNHKLESHDFTIGHVDAVLDPEDLLPFRALHYGQVGPCLTWLGLRACGRYDGDEPLLFCQLPGGLQGQAWQVLLGACALASLECLPGCAIAEPVKGGH